MYGRIQWWLSGGSSSLAKQIALENMTEGNRLNKPALDYASGLFGWEELSSKIDEVVTAYNTSSFSRKTRAPTNKDRNKSGNTDSPICMREL